MFSISRSDPRRRATWRWGGALGALLVLQSIVVAAVFWALANDSHRRTIDHALADDCTFFALSPPAKRVDEVRDRLVRDIHRDRFLGLFDAVGRPVAGNVARLPARPDGGGAFVTTVAPTQLPGKRSDVARVVVCAMPDGMALLTGVDLDDSQEALRLVWQSLLLGLVPGVLLALIFGFVAGRRAARQVDAVRHLTERIMAGDLNGRLPVPADPDSFGLLCADINRMLDRLQILVGDVRGIGDDIAHQMRTPLTRLRARIDRGLRDASDRAAFVATGERALVEIDTLLGIVSALLRLRELEDHARRSRFAPVDLARLVEDACDLYRPIAEDRGLCLTCAVEPVPAIDGDASLLMEAVANLIDNALKFGPAGGRIGVSLAPRDGRVAITVSDDGPGIPPADRGLVTQRFYRARTDGDGAGLGLSLVKAIADLHGLDLHFADAGSAVSLVDRNG
ncbi:histidine kinase [Sphingomonas sp. Leaf33]|uniref:sensor histidine kinase n=1 Tax=Sphingomonas sp. Leaf33 TaxID=1736215 RepID=UPI0006F2E0A7|nr:HAMP domain-containing sensor histidine kinase [Sphingomonas sp. Leaf33]KQN19314.1 histidine kinase [Sphingomonas sp. Leaf33]